MLYKVILSFESVDEILKCDHLNEIYMYLAVLSTGAVYKGRTIRKVMGGGGEGMGKKPKKNSCKGKCQEKKFVQRRRERKKIHAEGRSNCDFYLIYKICQQAC